MGLVQDSAHIYKQPLANVLYSAFQAHILLFHFYLFILLATQRKRKEKTFQEKLKPLSLT